MKITRKLKKIINKKTLLVHEKYFSPNRRKNLSPFRTDVPIRPHTLRTLENSENIGIGIK